MFLILIKPHSYKFSHNLNFINFFYFAFAEALFLVLCISKIKNFLVHYIAMFGLFPFLPLSVSDVNLIMKLFHY